MQKKTKVNPAMFCFQCQETAGNKGCTVKGVCGKTSDTANWQDLLLWLSEGLSEILDNLRQKGEKIDKKLNHQVTVNLFTTITNANFDDDVIIKRIEDTISTNKKLREKLSEDQIKNLSEAALYAEEDQAKLKEKSQTVGVLKEEDIDKRALRELIMYGLKGLSAYVKHANNLDYDDEELDHDLQKMLYKRNGQDLTLEDLLAMTLETGQLGVRGMALLDEANTGSYGNPEISKVDIGVGDRPGILISGHDLKDMQMLLEQSKDQGIDIYTHSEMLPANYYPAFKKYDHFHGNYGNAWWAQKKEFASFNGPILMTTNCIVPPAKSYQDKIFTTGAAGYPGCKHIEADENGYKDFSEIIEMAKKCDPPEEIETGEIVGGFAHAQVAELADKIVEAVKNGSIKKFVVMSGCDGRHKQRDYYTKFAEALPEDTVILTSGCAKYRYNKLNLGDIGGIPRVLDAGQCNDSYSVARIAMMLQELFELDDINELPVVYNVAWYEQKAVIVLLALLALGIKNIHLGPTLPGFLSPAVTKVLIEQFRLGGISEVDADMKAWVG